MKNRKEEMKVLKDMNPFFSEKIIPLIEIIRDEYQTQYEKDPITGKDVYILKPGNKKRSRVELTPTEADIITLQEIQKRLEGKYVFIDFFRFSDNEYGKKVFKGVELSIKLSRNYDYYKERMLSLGTYENFIPTISIKEGFIFSNTNLLELITDLRILNPSISIRLTPNLLDRYTNFFEKHLSKSDFLMLDIRSEKLEANIMELEEFEELNVPCKKILLNSPRPKDVKNGDFPNLKYTSLINNHVATKFIDYSLDGFGDFGGIKDSLPEDGGGNGMGAALGLIFVKEKNSFASFLNDDTSLGVRGYHDVRNEIIKRKQLLDPNNNCKAIEKIEKMNGTYGTWATWNNITLTRYIQQQTL